MVFAIVSDPIGSKFVNTFAKPGGNATGFTNLEASMGGKWLELLKELVRDVHDVVRKRGRGRYFYQSAKKIDHGVAAGTKLS